MSFYAKKLLKSLNYIIFIFMFCAPASAIAESYYAYGIGMNQSKNGVKIINLGFREDLFFGFSYQIDGGIFHDSAGLGRKSSGFISTMVGIEVIPYPLVLRGMNGIGFISDTDVYLGGHLEFNHNLYIGIKDKHDKSIGLSYRHISNAGLFMPNVGRDFLLVEVGIPW